MPELPEVETTRRGIRPHLVGRRIERLVVREARLRWPVPRELPDLLVGATIEAVERRAKYLLVTVRRGLERGTLLLHLGMSGSLRVLPAEEPAAKHDHVDLVLDSGRSLRLRDPRRFGTLLFTREPPGDHPLLRDLGPEPLSARFDGARLFALSRGRTAPVKCFLMDGGTVVGVGNIYASESLWSAGIDPRRPAGRISAPRYDGLARAVKEILRRAIDFGGTTLRDFVGSGGERGYFKIELAVYDRAGAPCLRCRAPIRLARVGQRSAFFCAKCQK